MYTIYHNSRCSKSRQTLALLEEQANKHNQKVSIIEDEKLPIIVEQAINLNNEQDLLLRDNIKKNKGLSEEDLCKEN